MKRFYLAGQQYFGNRGCEALVRSTVGMLRDQFGEIEVLCPSVAPELDQKQWPDAEDVGVRFVRSAPYSGKLKWWYRAARVAPPLKKVWIPRAYALPKDIKDDLNRCDVVIQIGGDNITLDYTPAGLISNTAFSEMSLRQDQSNVLWAASVGPFAKEPEIERYMTRFLNRMNLITVREEITADYLKSIGVVDNVRLVADPAFLMKPEELDLEAVLPKEFGEGILGLNFSSLVKQFGDPSRDAGTLYADIAEFVRGAVKKYDFSILLIPHVDPLDGATLKSDSAFMAPLLEHLAGLGKRVHMVPRGYNAAQLKYIISQCRFFMGARTHSTIAGFSMGVPTASIAYSIKARGLNRDLFGDERFVIPSNSLTTEQLLGALDRLVDEEDALRQSLREKIVDIKQRSRLSAQYLADQLS